MKTDVWMIGVCFENVDIVNHIVSYDGINDWGKKDQVKIPHKNLSTEGGEFFGSFSRDNLLKSSFDIEVCLTLEWHQSIITWPGIY